MRNDEEGFGTLLGMLEALQPGLEATGGLESQVSAFLTAGVGPVLSSTLLAGLLDLGHLTRKEIAARVGVAPLAGIVACSVAGSRCGVGGLRYAPSSTWRLWWRHGELPHPPAPACRR